MAEQGVTNHEVTGNGAPDPYAPFRQELERLRPRSGVVVDAHTHLGRDEDGHTLTTEELLEALDEIGPDARAVTFPLHDPERHPAYRVPNDRVLAWAGSTGGRVVPFCRLDPADDPIAEAERCLALGARGIKLHPRAQSFGFATPAAEAIFATARDAGVPILIHAGRGMPTMAPLAELALRFPEVVLILAHAGLADLGIFATRLREHPNVLYDTSTFSPYDIVELYARVPAERIVFASDIPYGRPTGGLYLALRGAAYAGLDDAERALVAGETMAAAVDGRPLPEPTPPRVPRIRVVDGTLQRLAAYLHTAFGAVVAGDELDVRRALPAIALARNVCREPDPGGAEEAIDRADAALAAVQELLAHPGPVPDVALRLLHGAAVIAGTEPVSEDARATRSASRPAPSASARPT